MASSLLAGKKIQYAEVVRSEEKGSDVNLAVQLVHDAHQGDFECAVVVSNDSDLVEAIRIVTQELNKAVGVINPHLYPSVKLLKVATFLKSIRPGALARSQFPDNLTDATGTFHKPPSW